MTVNVPVPAVGEFTVTVHVPAALVTHGLGVVGAPAPAHVKATEAPAAGVVVVPFVIVAVIAKSCGAPTRLVAGGDTVTVYAIHVLVAVAGGAYAALPGVTVTGTVVPGGSAPLSSITVIAPGDTVTAPGTLDTTVTVQVPAVVPVVEQFSLTSFEGSFRSTAIVVPSGAETNPAPRSCCTVTVKSCEVPARFVEFGLISAR